MATAAPYLDNFMMDLDSEPKPTYLSPSHKLTLWTLQSQRVIVMIFQGKIIQRLHISSEVLTMSELKFRKLRGYSALAYTLSSRS